MTNPFSDKPADAAPGGAPPADRPQAVPGSVLPIIKPPLSYTQKVLIAVAVSSAAILLAILVFYITQILVLCFAGVLFAVFLSAPSDLLAKYARIRRGYALGIVLLSLVVIALSGGYFMGSTVAHQAQQMAPALKEAARKFDLDLKRRFHVDTPDAISVPATTSDTATPIAGKTTETAVPEPNWIAERIIQARQSAADFLFSESFVQRAGGVAGGVVSSTFGIIAGVVVVFGVGLFFAINPTLYSQGLVRLFPLTQRPRTASILSEMGSQLQWWFVGQICSMTSVALLTFISLKILGIPMAATLAILAGLMNFIPNFGPILAAAPAVLIAFAPQGDQTTLQPVLAGWTILAYVIIQLLEGWIITPFFQQRVELPPALIIVSQVVFALLLGPIGLILATPILAAILVLIRMVYIEDVLGDHAAE